MRWQAADREPRDELAGTLIDGPAGQFGGHVMDLIRRVAADAKRALLATSRVQARRGAPSTCDQFRITHRATLP